ncbi:hypothetical protein BGZ46_009721 [Entomortierella lignicola]|nr:hypothetical protein BGZ46_009721 [Entomortierella lignicola]KAF9203444.1 hypothetical protein BGZ49_006419 [Haplosporangium sp. Z 27]
MAFFKFNGSNSSSKKNKTASASNTPRTSIQLSSADIADINRGTLMTHADAFEMLAKKGVPMNHYQAMIVARI